MNINTTFANTEDEMMTFVAIVIYMGIAELPSIDDYWAMETRVSQVTNLMSFSPNRDVNFTCTASNGHSTSSISVMMRCQEEESKTVVRSKTTRLPLFGLVMVIIGVIFGVLLSIIYTRCKGSGCGYQTCYQSKWSFTPVNRWGINAERGSTPKAGNNIEDEGGFSGSTKDTRLGSTFFNGKRRKGDAQQGAGGRPRSGPPTPALRAAHCTLWPSEHLPPNDAHQTR
ncbi:hypothetical protein DPEC_G00095560 [Dallia pectoralis]|uniref:Uncharacterized protein n=1 Tax=Dallia pectoralis TaxID=75939 RepID=A0ACC2GVZ8_DALPE|nr:hypothetical protein DPEC_G00095560 [Dallia pectoralis]